MRDQDHHPGSLPSRSTTKSKAQRKDDSIMGTNNSSIVSKRSVERLYFPNEDHFFRYFVKKPQRRSPLINRGYWLRMKAVDHVVRQFLEKGSTKKKVVINLGCGYDPLPWQCLTRYSSTSEDVKFIDIDYRDLMVKKRSVVESTSQLNSIFTNLEILDGDLLLRSDQYAQVGCDLRDLALLQKTLANVIDFDNCLVLLTAEVSITYMDVESADALIKWAGTLPDARFCLLEQLLPGGIRHPFAGTMMAHFEKLQTPLRPVQKYPTEQAQENRFKELGWPDVFARNLWELWSAPDFLDSKERRSLDFVEPFDEWEEFALFGCHYLLLTASTSRLKQSRNFNTPNPTTLDSAGASAGYPSPAPAHKITYSEYPKGQGCKRFASFLPIRSSDASEDIVGNFAGMGLTTRINDIDVYSTSEVQPHSSGSDAASATPSSRMSHTTTDLGDAGTLLVGGRTSPDTALTDCWLYHKWLGVWERTSDLPQPRYRHQAVCLGHGSVLISAGRCNSHKIANDYLIWNRSGWRSCYGQGELPPTVYGATFIINDAECSEGKPSRFGIIAGGISEDGILQDKIWRWELSDILSPQPMICFQRITHQPSLCRFGASLVNHRGNTYIVGGIIKDKLLKDVDEVLSLKSDVNCFAVSSISLGHSPKYPRPLLVGTTVVCTGKCMIVMGGSAVCFSFGTFWNKGCYTVHELAVTQPIYHSPIQNSVGQLRVWQYMHTIAPIVPTKVESGVTPTQPVSQNLIRVPRQRITSSHDFSQLMQAETPAILESLDIGSCTSAWTTTYLKDRVGADRQVIVHEATAEHMNFTTKNFSYVTKRFEEFIDEINSGGKLYLRSLSSEKPTELPADISRDFPTIAADFRLPSELSEVIKNAHSSPLRISGPVKMWLHYDVMANILCQVRGTKRLLLFPPSDVKHFSFEPGASSSSVDVFSKLDDYTQSHPYEACLAPGDVLFLPPLWLHSASPTSGMSVGVNVFFRNLTSGYASGKDVYGNRDLQAYEKGRQDIARIIKSFDGLPADIRGFYLQRLVDEFEGKAR